MAPRANWKGFLRLSLVTCPVALFPATSESEKLSFNQNNQNTGHRIKYAKVDAETGEEVSNEDIIKGYKVDSDTYVTVDKDELDNIALESTRTIDIDEFVPKSEIDELYLVRPYYIVPDGKVGHDAFAVSARPSAPWTRSPSPASSSPTGSTSSRWKRAARAWSGCCCGTPTRSGTRTSISTTSRT